MTFASLKAMQRISRKRKQCWLRAAKLAAQLQATHPSTEQKGKKTGREERNQREWERNNISAKQVHKIQKTKCGNFSEYSTENVSRCYSIIIMCEITMHIVTYCMAVSQGNGRDLIVKRCLALSAHCRWPPTDETGQLTNSTQRRCSNTHQNKHSSEDMAITAS